jgi:hypothetical protein
MIFLRLLGSFRLGNCAATAKVGNMAIFVAPGFDAITPDKGKPIDWHW